MRLLLQIQKQRKRRQKDPDDGWSEKEALKRWTSCCAVTEIDFDLLRFISNEFRVMPKDNLLALQGMVRELLSYTINQGLPFPDEFVGSGFKEHLRLACNAEEALLTVHFHIAELTEQVSRLNLGSNEAFGDWISRLRGMNIRAGWLGFLDLSGYQLSLQNFFGANFAMSRLDDTKLLASILRAANLEGVQLKNTTLWETNLQDANLEGADLKDADLSEANLRHANLEDTNLDGANLDGANLDGAILKGTILENKKP